MKLTIHEGDAFFREVSLESGCSYRLGRALDNDIRLLQETVSRNHAELYFEHGQWMLRDLGSTDGTFVGGRRVRQAIPLEAGDTFEIGPFRLRISEFHTVPTESRDFGPMRGVPTSTPNVEAGPVPEEVTSQSSSESAAPESDEIDVTLSAQADDEIELGSVGLVDFRLELSIGAEPLEERLDVTVKESEHVRVLLTTHGSAVEIISPRVQTVAPPSAGHPVQGVFELRGVAPGSVQIALIFRQGGTELGTIRFATSVVATASGTSRATGKTVAAQRDRSDDETLILLIEQKRSGDEIRYEYQLYSEEFGFNFLTLQSQPLQDRGGGAAANAIAYVEGIYRRVTEDVLSLDDARQLARKVRALGSAMGRELFDPEVSRNLWPLRNRISTVQVTSWEPYIPWELVRLRNPDTDEADEKFLCEYGLIRSFSGRSHPRALELERWAYLVAEYPNGLEPAIGAEVAYFTHDLPARGVQPVSIPSGYDAFFEAMENADFDVLHIACHGESRHDRIEDAALIIGDSPGPNGVPSAVTVDATTVREGAKLERHQPLVFLNACESGRHGSSLTAWGGWPNAFLDAGAGAFVGTSWPVREKPASTFATAFYDTLLAGETLAAAASEARTATKQLGDASWLAFKVFGHPRARRPQ